MPSSTRIFETLDGNEAVARVAYALSEVVAIYPITPATPMGEWADAWAARQVPNLWGDVPAIVEMQSEAGAAGVLHGAIQTGSLATSFTASQGLLLMLPDMFRIAGELTPAVLHVATRSIATHALSIFGDHSDIQAARGTGWAILGGSGVQEAHDLALIAHAASLVSRIPFVHFLDGFRTSHELSKVEVLPAEVLRDILPESAVLAHRARALSPERPVIRGSAQNPDVFFASREAANRFHADAPGVVQDLMDRLATRTGRAYRTHEYHGHPEADRVVILMGSAVETAVSAAGWLNERGGRVGVLQVRLLRPFDPGRLVAALPPTARSIAVLDRSKEPGSDGEPLYLDVLNALHRAGRAARVSAGRYGLGSHEFTPAMARAVFEELARPEPRATFTVGIDDDITHLSLAHDPDFDLEPDETFRAIFHGLGSDGTVGANKETLRIIGERTDHHVQGYFVYDSRKAGAVTASHLRFGPRPIRAPYLVSRAHFIGVHQPLFLERFDVAAPLLPGGTLLLNTPHDADTAWASLPASTRRTLADRRARLFVIDASRVARECGTAGRINTVMQACFFSVSGVLPHDEALAAIRDSIRASYARKGPEIVDRNLAALDQTLARLRQVPVPPVEATAPDASADLDLPPRSTPAPADAPPIPLGPGGYVDRALPLLLAGRGDALPVSAMPVDGTFPTGTARLERRNLAEEIPVWDPHVCIQCGRCVFVCPHAAIRGKVYPPTALTGAPPSFRSHPARLPAWHGRLYTLQVAPEDCTGCGLCIDVCPARDKSEARRKALYLRPQPPLRAPERANWEFFLGLPEVDRREAPVDHVRGMQVLTPLFEFPGACAGCGETPYLRLLTQLFGDRLRVANATGCSSIYGGNLPTTPWACGHDGRGPAWSNSLFEDAAEFGLGFRVSLDAQRAQALAALEGLVTEVDPALATRIRENPQRDEADIHEQREDVASLKVLLAGIPSPGARRLLGVADALVRQSVWVVGGDGWAYDIGFGGLDHVLASGRNVKMLVLDTEVYSNTGGQASKSTPRGAVAKFSAGGKALPKKDLGRMAMTYGHAYVATVAMGARDEQTLRAFLEAEAHDGPALIIAYSHCIAHGIEMSQGLQSQKAAVQSGQWILYRFDPARVARGLNPLVIDSAPPTIPLADYFQRENRFRSLSRSNPEDARRHAEAASSEALERWQLYQHLAARPIAPPPASTHGTTASFPQTPPAPSEP